MNRIRILPEQVANQIAAGEVIERPASVLKELLENALDAQAKQLQIEIRGGGKSLIRVTDDGHGMSRDDALLSLERHATSKIFESADIGAIHTLGFRGEAIPSIASVSRFRMLTRERESDTATEIEINGGKILSVKEAGSAPGTTMEIRSLFYNLPARRKFLRSDATELGHLQHVFFLQAMAHPDKGWTLLQDQRVIHQLQAATSKDPQQALLERIRALHGGQLASQLLPAELKREGISIRGWIGKPGLSRSNRSELYTYVNMRPVDSRAIYYGLIEGYHGAVMKGRYPVCFLFIEIDPAAVDVNIHPAKREVRFREDARVQGLVVETVRRALGGTAAPRNTPLHMSLGRITSSQPPAFLPSFSKKNPSPDATVPFPFQETPSGSATATHSPLPATMATPFPSASGITQGTSVPESPVRPNAVTILGVFAELYIVAKDSQGLLIVDQHAAHERVLFEQTMRRLGKDEAPSQKLLLPQTVELPPREALLLREQLPHLEKMGFGLSEFGERTFMLDALPPFLKKDDAPTLLRKILDEIDQAGRGINRDRMAEETVAKTVCRHAIKANDVLHPEEMKRLIVDLMACESPLTCPHGRPTLLRLTAAELEKKFGRKPLEG